MSSTHRTARTGGTEMSAVDLAAGLAPRVRAPGFNRSLASSRGLLHTLACNSLPGTQDESASCLKPLLVVAHQRRLFISHLESNGLTVDHSFLARCHAPRPLRLTSHPTVSSQSSPFLLAAGPVQHAHAQPPEAHAPPPHLARDARLPRDRRDAGPEPPRVAQLDYTQRRQQSALECREELCRRPWDG
ncbi:hypothetical protein AURDEDRAFT_177271 [Auricularia subglabra TFB-10046 SS5]|uniref:Uncharacterized protein n=1 Tax=Auricularia subglabra (strain TFB-10046 / SS5) TaxID=717982 RepID=J0LB34_AURST|nr:hypothetical protein AURDEDRAFT_177271 [Auricularia subglabra TFB-10046 SS5]